MSWISSLKGSRIRQEAAKMSTAEDNDGWRTHRGGEMGRGCLVCYGQLCPGDHASEFRQSRLAAGVGDAGPLRVLDDALSRFGVRRCAADDSAPAGRCLNARRKLRKPLGG